MPWHNIWLHMPVEQLQLRLDPTLELKVDQIYSTHTQIFEQLRQEPTYLEKLFLSMENIGEQYALDRAQKLLILPHHRTSIEYALKQRDLGTLEKNDSYAFDWALGIVRDAERLKRRIISREISKNPESLNTTERILLLGGLVLSEQSDDIFWDQWRPQVKDSPIGKKLAQEEAKTPGSAANFLPGDPDDIRWFTRNWIRSGGELSPKDILLTPYHASLPGVKNMIRTLDDLVTLLEEAEVKFQEDDYGYKDFFYTWANCLRGRNDLGETSQKLLEDDMMTAFRDLDPDAPIFMIPWVEYDYDDPAGVAMAPSFRIGVKSTSSESAGLIEKEEELKNWIMEYTQTHGYAGTEAVSKAVTQHRVWTAHAGLNHIIAMISEVLPNDPDLRRQMGSYIFPDIAAQARGVQKAADAAIKVYPPEILSVLEKEKLSIIDVALRSSQAHELFHPVGVTKKGANRLGKLANLFEETKATFGGMVVQVEKINDINFTRKLLAFCLNSIPRELSRDGNPTSQGYANRGRVVANIAEKVGILALNRENVGLVLDLANNEKIYQFWQGLSFYVDWCIDTYKRAEEVSDDKVEITLQQISKELDSWLGKDRQGEKVIDSPLIAYVKEKGVAKKN